MIVDIKSKKYLSEIDGIKALSIIAVIIFHFNKDFLPSGYLGVDIFFVISGFLITGSLMRNEKVRFCDFIFSFYKKRLLRILPALSFFVLVISIITHLVIQNAGNYYLTAVSSLFGISNIFLSLKQFNYWGSDLLMNPFMHTWSLGVELQFYLFYPLFIWLLKCKKLIKKSLIYLL